MNDITIAKEGLFFLLAGVVVTMPSPAECDSDACNWP